jgi:hypothetical protein
MSRYATIVLLAASPLLAACGGSSPSADSAASSASGKRQSMIAFATCMRAHGVPSFPDPGSNGRGGLQIQASQRAGSGASMTVNGVSVSAPAFQSAMRTCHNYLPNGGAPSAADVAKMKSEALAMARCMRSHGVPNFPDPQFHTGSNGGVAFRLGEAGGRDLSSSPAFQAAQRACGSIFGGAGPPKTG